MEHPKLQDGEKILYEAKPVPAYVTYMVVMGFIPLLFFFGILGIPLFIGLSIDLGLGAGILVLMIGLVIILGLSLLVYVVATNSYKNRYYWVTNKRVMYRRGVFGYQISSIPMNRISDVILSRTFFENMFGFGSVKLQTLAGQISAGRSGSEGDLAAVPDPEKAQEIILDAMKHFEKVGI